MAELTGYDLFNWARDLFPINRSITGPGVRETLIYIKNLFPELTIHEVPSGTIVFDWTIPDEWSIESAYIESEKGERIVDFANTNLHVVAYSEPVDEWMSYDELDKNLFSLPDQPDAIPYITSFYKRNWGFCLTHNQRLSLDKKLLYHVVINSKLEKGSLTYGELIIPGKSEKEVLLSTYICHPSMANNELSGPLVSISLAHELLLRRESLYFSYRFILIIVDANIYQFEFILCLSFSCRFL